MIRRLLPVSALAFVFLLVPAIMQAAPILLNGSFEEGPPDFFPFQDIDISSGSTAITGWTVTSGGIDLAGPPWDVSDGVRAIDLDGRNALSGGIEQTLPTTLNESYRVTFDLSGNPAAVPVVKRMRVTIDGFSQDYAHDSSGQDIDALLWQTITFSFVASGASATLNFTSLTPFPNSYGALIDHVRVTVPSHWDWLLLGFSGRPLCHKGRHHGAPTDRHVRIGSCAVRRCGHHHRRHCGI